MKIRNVLLITATLPMLGACVAYGDGYGGGPGYAAGPGYYGDAYPSSGYIEFNNSYSHHGGYRGNYWSHDRAREDNFHRNAAAHAEEHHEAAHAEEHHEEHGGEHGAHAAGHR